MPPSNRLEWLVESTAPEHYRFFLRPNCIYRLRVRPHCANRDFSMPYFMLLEVVEENPDSPALQAELEHYLTPVVLNEPDIAATIAGITVVRGKEDFVIVPFEVETQP